MKIAYFLNSYPNVHKIVAHDEMIEMHNRGHHILAVSNYPGERELTEEIPFQVATLKHKVAVIPSLITFLINPIQTVIFIKQIKPHIGIIEALSLLNFTRKYKLKDFDLIHSHFVSNAALKGYLVAKFLKIPFSVTSHHSDIIFNPLPELKEIIIESSLFITISNYNKNFLVDKYSVDPGKIIVNFCGIYINQYARKNIEYPVQFTIISVTGLRPVKGVQYLIEACKILSEEKIQYQCQIIGGGPDQKCIQEIIDEQKLSENIHLLGKIHPDYIKDYLLKSSVFVLPSLSEGIPVAVMEAMAMELPVVATNITGLPEIIEDDVNGYLVPPKEPRALAEKIIDLYNNPEKRIALGKAAQRTIEQKFNLQKNVARFEELITRQV